MRCGLVRLITRRNPYDLKIRRKGWNSFQRGDSGALINIAESRMIGRYCAHKICRLVEKSSKLFCRVLSGSNISSRKISSAKTPFFDNWNELNFKYPLQSKPLSRNGLDKANPRTNHESFSFAKRTSSKIGLSQLNYSAVERDIPNSSKPNPSRPYHALSKHKVPRYKRYSSQKILTRRTVNSNYLSNKRLKTSNIKNKFAPSRKLYTLRSPFVTYPDCEDNIYVNRIKHSLRSQHTDLKNSNNSDEFQDHKVLNHLNETSYLSLCGCEICDKKLKEYEHKNKKINQLLQNKIMKILNYCKKKNPFYRIYTQKDRSTVDEECLREFSMYGVNGWLEYLDAYGGSDKSPCVLKNDNHKCKPSTMNKCVNTNSEHNKADGFYNVPLKPINDNLSEIGSSQMKSKETNNKNETSVINDQITNNKCGENQETLKFNNEETSFKNIDNSTTQTQGNCDPSVTNYYYVTNNTLNTSCCCREENLNETKNDKDTAEEPNRKGKNQSTSCEAANDFSTNNKNKTITTSRIKRTLNKVYNVMMTPINNENSFYQTNKQKSNTDINTKPQEEKNGFTNSINQKSIKKFNIGQGDSPSNLENFENFQVLDFDAYMDLKYNELKEKSFGDSFRYLDDLRFSEMTKKSLIEETNLLERDTEQQMNSIKPLKKNAEDNKHPTLSKFPNYRLEQKSPINPQAIDVNKENVEHKNLNMTYDHEWKCDDNVPPCHELGPLDCTKNFMLKNIERYKEKANILTRGPNFSQFPNSTWRDSLFQYDDKLSKTFDVSNRDEGNETIKINTDKRRDLAKYSEINIAIEKVKKRISSIINESDENVAFNQMGNIYSKGIPVKSTRKVSSKQRLSKRIVPLVINQVESLNSSNYIRKRSKCNYLNRENENNYLKGQKIKNKLNERAKGRYSYNGKQYDHPPSSVHLNEIIEAIKENRNNDKCDYTIATKPNERELGTSNYKRNKCYRVYKGAMALTNMRKTPLKNNAFVFSTNAEPIFGIVNTEDLLNRGSISRNFSTSSKYKPFLENLENKNNKKGTTSNFLEGTIFPADSFIPEELERENAKKMNRQTFYLKYTENKPKQREDDTSLAEENKTSDIVSPENQTFSQAEYVEYRSSCKEELFKKSIDIFANNTAIENKKKNEYSPAPTIPGIVERYNIKHSKDKQIFSQIENNINKMSTRKFWKVWDPKSWENEADICRNELLSKGFSERNDRYDQNQKNIIFNDALQITSKCDDNCTRPEVSMNDDLGKELHKINPFSTIHSSVNYSNCFNVGDLGLNYTSFDLNKSEEKKERKGNSKVERNRRDDLRKSAHGSESRINNVGVENTSMSRHTELHTTVRETRTVGLRPCNKNEVLPNSFRIRNSFLMDGNNTLRPVISTNVLYRRQASSGIPDNNDIKTYMSEKIKNIKRIDHVDYTREEKCVSDKEAIESIKVKESFVAQSSVNGNTFEEQASSENDIRLGICSKEIELRTKHKAVQDSSLTKQTTEEINVSGLFPEGKKSVHGKVVSVYGKPKNKFTGLQNRVKGLEAIHGTHFKEPVTVQMVYETTTDHSVGEHIDKAKNKIHSTEYEMDKLKGKSELKQDEEDKDRTEQLENKTKVWKKYDPKMAPDTKKYFVDTKRLNKAKRSRSVESIYNEHEDNQENSDLQWQAPRNRVIDKLVNRSGLINDWKQDSEMSSPKMINNIANEETSKNDTLKKRKDDKHDSVEVYYKNDNVDKKREQETQLNQMKMLSVNNETLENELDKKDKADSTWNNDKLTVEEEILKGNIKVSDEKIKTVEGKGDTPTIGESKYEIDSDSVDDRSNLPKEKEKLVITHFKQFRRAESVDPSNKIENNNFVLEASMLRVTLVEEKKAEKSDKNLLEVQSFESISNDTERELNDMISPYVKEFMLKHDQVQEKKMAQLKSKEYFLNMLYQKDKRANKDRLTKSKTELEEIENFKDNDIGIKIETKIIENDQYTSQDMSHILRASIEKLYMKHVNYIMSTEPSDLSHQLRASMENLYTKKYTTSREDVGETESTAGKSTASNERESSTMSLTNKTTDSKNTNVDEEKISPEGKPSKLTKTYDLIAKELNKIFVKDTTQTENSAKLSKEDIEAKINAADSLKTNTEPLQQSNKDESISENNSRELLSKDTESSFQSAEEKSVDENKAAIESSKPFDSKLFKKKIEPEDDITSNDPATVRGKSQDDQMINVEKRSKPAAKSYYSYDSTLKPKSSKQKKGVPSDNTLEVRETAEDGINDDQNQSSGKKNRAESRLRIPIFKPKLLRKRKTSPKVVAPRDSHSDKVKRSGVKDVTENKMPTPIKKSLNEKLSTQVVENVDIAQKENTSGAEQNEKKLVSDEESKNEKKIIRTTPSSFYSYDSTIKPHVNKGEKKHVGSDNDNETNLNRDISISSDGSSGNRDEVEFADENDSRQNNKNLPQDFMKSKEHDEIEKDFQSTSLKEKQEHFLNLDEHEVRSTTKAKNNDMSDVTKPDLESEFELAHQKNVKTAADYIDKFEDPTRKTDENISVSEPLAEKNEDTGKSISSERNNFTIEAAQGEVKTQTKESNEPIRRFSKDMIIEDIEEKLDTTDNKGNEEMLKSEEVETDTTSAESDKKVEEQSEIASLNQYKKQDGIKETYESISSGADEKKEEYKIDKEVFKERMRKEKKERESLKPLKQYVPYEGERKQNATLEKWEQEPTYMKNLRPAFYKMSAEEKRLKNYDDNEKTFKNLKTLNRISSASKYSDCECNKKEKWTADMCCSLEEENENKKASQDVHNQEDESRNKLGRPSKARSSDWPDNLIRKKDAVIKQPMTPRPPWRN